MKRVRAFAMLVAVGCLLLAAIARPAGPDPRHAEMRRAVTRLLGTPDLALSSSSRWLRHPSQAEPGAAFSDAPAALDPDPGGAAIGPPLELLRR
jgi:hypothetical protein